MHSETIPDFEIQAYLDDELDLPRRLEVEEQLSNDPEAARLVMEHMRLRTSLRLLAACQDETPEPMRAAAARLSERLRDRPERGVRRLLSTRMAQLSLAAVLLVVIALPVRDVVASPPPYVGDAVKAYRTALLRKAMTSQVETPKLDAGEVQRRTSIRLPRLPEKWTVTDAQIFPSQDGPALQVMVRTPDEVTLSIFAVHADNDAPDEPTAVRHEGASVAYWREGDMSYAVTGGEALATVDAVAEDLADDEPVGL